LDIKLKNKVKQLLNTTALRLSLKYSLIYIFIFGLIFVFIYGFISSFVEDQIKINLIQESKRIEKIYSQKGINGVKKYIETHTQYKGEDHKYYLFVDKNNNIIAGDLKKWPSSLKIGKDIHNIWISEDDIKGSVEDGDGFWPMTAIRLKNGSKLLIAQGVKGTEDLRETMFSVMAGIFAVIVILTVILGVFLGRKVLWHIENINSAYKNIMNGNLSSRIKLSQRNDEFDSIASQLNEMLDKIEYLISEGKQITDNIAHDLRTPLNRIRNRLEIAIMNQKDNACAQVLEQTIYDIDNVIKTFNNILTISQVTSQTAKKSFKKINISNIMFDIIELYEPLCEEKKLNLDKNIQKDVYIIGNKHLITQSISNLLDNAVKYTNNGGKITIKLNASSDGVNISICDSGIGVDKKDFKNITKRFFRCETSRHTPGNGLGLSLVEAVANLHKAKLEFRDNNPGLCAEIIFKKY
jgi:signal transduction histidine kinase